MARLWRLLGLYRLQLRGCVLLCLALPGWTDDDQGLLQSDRTEAQEGDSGG